MAQEEFDVEAEETIPTGDEEIPADVGAEEPIEGGAGGLGSLSFSDEDIEGLAEKNPGDPIQVQMIGTVGDVDEAGKKTISFDSGFVTEGEGGIPAEEEGVPTEGNAIAGALAGGEEEDLEEEDIAEI